MLHLFSQNLWTRINFLSLSLGSLYLLFSAPVFSQSHLQLPSQTLGILETFKTLSKINKDKEKKVLDSLRKKEIINLDSALDIKINSFFLRSLLFFSKNKILNSISENECSFYALIENGFIGKDIEGFSQIPITLKMNDGTIKNGIIPLKLFLDFNYSKKCSQYKEYALLFSPKYVEKTFEKIDFKIGETNTKCESIHQKWISNPLTPYLCKIPQSIKKEKIIMAKFSKASSSELETFFYEKVKLIKLYKKIIPIRKSLYLKNLCQNLNSSEKFCSLYLAQDAWTKILNKELPDYKITFKCKQILGIEKVGPEDKKKCVELFNSFPKICSLKGQLGKTSLFPLSSCDDISTSLAKGRLYTNYHDCPSNIYNQGITNLNRIIMHFTRQKRKNPSLYQCPFKIKNIFSKSVYRSEYDDSWPFKICYENKLLKKEICNSYIPGFDKSSMLSENNVLENILKKNWPVSKGIKCFISNKKSYNPSRVSSNNGCHVIYDFKNCNNGRCSKSIIINKRKIDNIIYKDAPTFNYFPSKISSNNISAVKFALDHLGLKQKKINNLNQIKEFLKLKKGIIHGVGCIEEIYPSRFKLRSINQCQPIPFIIDNVIEKEMNNFLSVRTAIDDLHSPRLINWPFIYNALKSYEGVHSINSWTLYGIKKSL